MCVYEHKQYCGCRDFSVLSLSCHYHVCFDEIDSEPEIRLQLRLNSRYTYNILQFIFTFSYFHDASDKVYEELFPCTVKAEI